MPVDLRWIMPKLRPEVVLWHEDGHDVCLICDDEVPSIHQHHVIPRNAGGTNGPQVGICNDCHDGIHDAAKKKMTAVQYMNTESRPKQEWVGGIQIEKADYFIRVIINSEAVAKTSQHKTTAMNLRLSGDEERQLANFAKALGKSKEASLKILIQHSQKVLMLMRK